MSAKSMVSPKQAWSIQQATARVNIWHGSVRSGKTVGKFFAFAKFCQDGPAGDFLLVGRTIDALKRNVIGPMQDFLGNLVVYHPGLREMKCFGRRIHVVGASDERAEGKIRGATFAGAAGDELTLWPQSFYNMMLSRLSITGSRFFGSTNPDNPRHWLKTDTLDRVADLNSGGVNGLKIFHFKIDDNPFLDPAYVESLKREYIGLWYKRFIDGEWCVAEGAIYDFFDEKLHCIDYLPEADYHVYGIDYGTTNPTVFIRFGVKERPLAGTPRVWAEKEFYYDPVKEKRQRTDSEFSQDFIRFLGNDRRKCRKIYCDPSAESFQLQLRHDGVINLVDAENDVLQGIRTVARLQKRGDYMIYKPGCPKLIEEKYAYSWDKKKQMLGVDEPLKVNDHASDAERYPIHSHFSGSRYDITRFKE